MILDANHVMTFGKFKGETIQHILDVEPSYLTWCRDNIGDFEVTDEILEQLNDEEDYSAERGIWDMEY